jgi:hypothetical protein
MYRIAKGELTVTADTEAELQIAIACLTETVVNGVPAGAPAWRVGGPPDSKPLPPIAVPASSVSVKLTNIDGEPVEITGPIRQFREVTVLDTDQGQVLVGESAAEVTDAILRGKVGL